jgi:hypothetical protein
VVGEFWREWREMARNGENGEKARWRDGEAKVEDILGPGLGVDVGRLAQLEGGESCPLTVIGKPGRFGVRSWGSRSRRRKWNRKN